MLMFNNFGIVLYCLLVLLLAIPAIILSVFTLSNWWELRSHGHTTIFTSLPSQDQSSQARQYTHTPKRTWLPPSLTLLGLALFICGVYMMRPTEEVAIVDEHTLERALSYVPRLREAEPGTDLQFVCYECAVVLLLSQEPNGTFKVLANVLDESDETMARLRAVGEFHHATFIRDLDGKTSVILQRTLSADVESIQAYIRKIFESLAPAGNGDLRIQVTSSSAT